MPKNYKMTLKSCRICNTKHRDTRNLFTSTTEIEKQPIDLEAIYLYIFNLKLDIKSKCAAEICGNCFVRMKDAYTLKKLAEATHRLLMQPKPKEVALTVTERKQEISECGTRRGKENVKAIKREKNPAYKATSQKESNTTVTPLGDKTLAMPADDNSTFEDVEESENSFIMHDDPKLEEATDGVEFIRKKLLKVDNVNHKKSRGRKVTKNSNTCQVCGRSFARKSNLVDHLRLHANVRLFQCPHCDKAFVQIANYRTHVRVHTNERPFKCHLCPKTYTQSSALKLHMCSHTGERKFSCPTCGKAFSNVSDLNKHKRTHDIVKPFKCDGCERTFAQKVNMLSHSQRMHKPKSPQNVGDRIIP